MGVCQSGDAAGVDEGAWDTGDADFHQEDRQRKVHNEDGTVKDFDAGENDREDDMFVIDDAEEVEEGKEFLAVKPWKGQIAEPNSHPEVNCEAPDEQYQLEYAYGYRCEDSRQNVYYNSEGNVTYMTACIGVILNISDNTQQFFGGGEVDNKSKQVAGDATHHNNDIMAMNVNHGDRSTAVTGQVGKAASVHVWNTCDGSHKQRFKLPRNARGVSAIAISKDCKYVACADKHNDHNITVWDCNSGSQVMTEKSGPDLIYDLSFTKADGAYDLWSAGVKHFAHWNIEKRERKKGIYGGKSGQTSHACVTACDQGRAYSGGSNSKVHVWEGRSLIEVLEIHKGFVGAIMWNCGKLYTGGKDGKICIINTATLQTENCLELSHGLIRAIDVKDDGLTLVAGFRNGKIIEKFLYPHDGEVVLMNSHNDGEVWGLAQSECHVYTSGDDNQVITWDPEQRRAVGTHQISDKTRKAKRNRASTLSKYPDSQASRAVSIGANGHIAICANDGHVYIRDVNDIGANLHELEDSKEWCEVCEYSPSGAYLAVGSHDTDLYIYKTEDYSLVGKANSHKASITCIDWSMDDAHIKSVCNAYELLYFDVSEGGIEHDPSGRSNSQGYEWATQHAKFGWLVDGIFPRGTDGTHINGVDFNEDQSLISCGDDYGLVQLFRNPCRKGHMPRSYRAHSEHVVRVQFGRGNMGHWLFSVGGYDQTMLQWKKC